MGDHTEHVKIGQCAGKYRNVNQRQKTHSPQWSKEKNLRSTAKYSTREKEERPAALVSFPNQKR